jgi:N4-gp56 family major capsid protein
MATTNLTSTSALSAKMAVYYDRMMLDRLRAELVFHKFGQSKNLPKNSGKIVQWFRRTDLAGGSAGSTDPTFTALTEGTIPTAIGLSATSISAQLSQYGNFTQTSDLIQMTSIDDEIEAAVDTLSWQAQQTVDGLDRAALDAGTNVKYGGGKSALSATAAGDVLSGGEVRKGVRALKVVNARPYDGGLFVWIIHPNNSYDLQGDTASGGWVNANTYVATTDVENGEIGKFGGARFIETTQVTSTTTGTSGSAAVYSTHLLSQGALGVVDFDGGVHVYVKKSGDQDTSNPLNQFATVGYKLTYANKMLDENRQVTYKVGSGF